jgi:uncharacterized YigZ family protein
LAQGKKDTMDYKTIAAPVRAEYIEKRSRFIASLTPIASEREAAGFIEKIKAECRDARHNTFAYLVKDGAQRYSDDGEPQGTAGLPELEVLRRRGVVNTAIVITRYFGGILLGAPGLVRAYCRAATDALDAAEIIKMRACDILCLRCGYAFYAQAERLCRSHGGVIHNRSFEETVCLELYFYKDRTAAFADALTQASNGGLETENCGEIYLSEKEMEI